MKKSDYITQMHQHTAHTIMSDIITYLEENSYNERIFYLLWDKYDFARVYEVEHWNTAKKIAPKIGIMKPDVKDSRAISRVFRFIYQNDDSMFRNSGCQRLIRIPPLR